MQFTLPHLSPTQKGREAEQLAVSFLKKKGLKILQQNYSTKYAEIDIIAREKKTIIAIEVKSGIYDLDFLLARIDYRKRKKIERALEQYCKENDYLSFSQRFDIIIILMPQKEIHYYPEESFYES
jgi:putative endonuclease